MTVSETLVPFAKITKISYVRTEHGRTDTGPLKLPDGIGASHNNSQGFVSRSAEHEIPPTTPWLLKMSQKPSPVQPTRKY